MFVLISVVCDCVVEQLQYLSAVSVQSLWCTLRFLYDSLSLCEHIFTVDPVYTLTVIISCIFSLDSTDGQSEITVRSTATESRWSSSVKV